MFHSAALKLTLSYLGIIMVLSIGFSGVLYHVASGDLERNARRQLTFFNNTLTPLDFNTYSHLRQQQLNEDRKHLRQNLTLFNLGVLALGGVVSYALARRTLQPIEEALDAQTRFTADASHELRTPLTAIQAETEVALRDAGLTKAEAVRLLRSNLEEVAKLKTLAEGLLSLANQNGKPLLDSTASLKVVLNEATNRLAKAAKAKRIIIDDKTADTSLRGDHQSLAELFVILLDNAIKYSQADSRVELLSRRHSRTVFVSVVDHGHGIEPKDLPHIFDRFYRSDASRSKNKTDGYGLGLAIAKKIVELHEGFVEVKSAPHQGSTFIVHLPLA